MNLRITIVGLYAIVVVSGCMCWGWLTHTVVGAKLPEIHSGGNKSIALVNEGIDRHLLVNNYRSNGEWIGRLILPSQTQIDRSSLVDWVWVEIKHAPLTHQQLVGKTVRLTWQPQSIVAANARQVTTNIQFTPETIASQQQGNIHPQRLNGRSHVGALESLAGARSADDVYVSLTGVSVAEIGSQERILTIDREPMQITGTLSGLVKIIGTDLSRTEPLPMVCPGAQPCASEYFRVKHYNPDSHEFDGQIETIRIPQIPVQKSGLFPSVIRDLALSPAGSQGWYIYGDRNSQGLFTVAAIQPRSLFGLAPTVNLTDRDAKLDYLNRQHWENTSAKKGQLEQVTFDRQPVKLGDKALAIHLFGGIGGKTGDAPGLWQTVTGHFAYGIATAIADEFTHELRWSIEYNQVYAHNQDGIIAGKQDWATYMGHLQRGWLATRPVADLLISYPPVTEDYDFGEIEFSPLTELERQLQVLAARYRTGNGTGSASVTPATSCVQDANQALYATISQLNRTVLSQPQIQTWLTTHPHHPQTQRFRDLKVLGAELTTNLAPLGIVRQDWQQNQAKLAGTNGAAEFISSGNPVLGLMSWRTMLPRGAQDGIAKVFSQHGAAIWFLNTYQVGGLNPDIIPIAPTILFGQIPLLSTMTMRLWAGITTLPKFIDWLFILGLLIGYSFLAMAIGFRSRFLTVDRQFRLLSIDIRSLIHLFFLPAVLEEILFRLLLIPHPIETAVWGDIYRSVVISLGLFVIYHPLNALTFFKAGNPTFMDWRFLTLAGLLGIVCSIAYLFTGSIWTAILIHWLVVVVWLKILGGDRSLT